MLLAKKRVPMLSGVAGDGAVPGEQEWTEDPALEVSHAGVGLMTARTRPDKAKGSVASGAAMAGDGGAVVGPESAATASMSAEFKSTHHLV